MIVNEDLSKDFKALHEERQEAKRAYYKCLADPFTASLVRVPGPFTAPSGLLRDRETFQITTSAAGDFVGYFAPENMFKRSGTQRDYVFLAQAAASTTYYQSLTFNNHMGAAIGNYATRLSQNPGGQYHPYFSQVRLVSAGIRFKYIGRADAHAGLIAAGLISDVSPMDLTPLLTSSISETMFAIRAAPAEQLVCNWYPFDALSQSFLPYPASSGITGTETQQVFVFHGFGLPAGTVLDVEIVRNYEYIPQAQYHELLTPPSSDKRFSAKRDPAMDAQLQAKAQSWVTSTGPTMRTLIDWVTNPIGALEDLLSN